MNPVELDLSRETIENVVMKPFVFTHSSIADIRARYFPGARLTRIEVLMEFLLRRHFQTMLKISHNKDSLKYMVSHVINLRPRIMPPLIVRAFGNMVGIFHFRVEMSSSSGDGVGEFKVVPHVRSVTSGPNITKHLLRFQDREAQLEYLEERFNRLEEMSRGGSEQIVPIFFASQSKFSMYEMDFGWGKPEFVSTTGTVRVNHVLFLDCKDGKGIQAFVGLKEEVMALFEKDEEILAYAESPLANSRDMDMERQRPRM
ncbi:hypothetical protein MLD38_005629 [Melastoma candidum]|nr:hypothetical protein MLD38_005629 [Melastoma candidum]